MDQAKVIAKLRRMCEAKSQKEIASGLQISPQYLSDILKGRREPGPMVLASMGLTRRVDYKYITSTKGRF